MKPHPLIRGNRTLLLLALFLCSIAPRAFPQGLLTPPGAPLPTMKTLDQVEARTPIPGGTTAFNASAPGSYYLTGNLGLTGAGNGITVTGNSVTIDLNGFTLSGPASGNGVGVFVTGGAVNVTVRNGNIRSWGSNGINALGSSRFRAENLRILNNGSTGLIMDVNGVAIDCIADSNGGVGIFGNSGCLITKCQAISSGTAGFSFGNDCIFKDCIARTNTGPGILAGSNTRVTDCSTSGNVTSHQTFTTSAGISVADYSIITHCVANDNTGYAGISLSGDSTADECVAEHNGTGVSGYGIVGSSHTVVRRSSTFGNQKSGISFGISSIITDNKANLNGQGVTSPGFDGGNSQYSRIEANDTRDNTGPGILASGLDIIVRNIAGGNTPNYTPSSGNNFAPVQAANAITNPLANMVVF